MNTSHYYTEIVKELSLAADLISDQEAEMLVDEILKAKKIFVAGAGRSGLMGKSFAMRMMHMGLDSYVIGETVTPNLTEDDLIIFGSGSGETKSLISMAEKAKSIDGKVIAVTIFPDSTLGKLADVCVKLPGSPKDQSENDYKTIQPMGSLFEQTLLLFFDAVILRFMERKGLDTDTMFGRHANLE
ncbi:6-phospho-3-hexuloisomerase [Fictibacillus sp. KU28468]|uniref:6-phospho-3-hexuloisomerase n=1 Tax=Fictibacillus sp. KU28468 TaxID=2991053 RepID=UPI00223D7886|nr:6-phospho-3-hexuloisomerase [Fictibacillus sp. KU28468]UZJ79874.1 6-phospho-3-hexuloisomerase [Fictibacillus sp. KU28468]